MAYLQLHASSTHAQQSGIPGQTDLSSLPPAALLLSLFNNLPGPHLLASKRPAQ